MDTEVLERRFGRIGARVKLVERTRPRFRWTRPAGFRIDVGADRRGRFFELSVLTGERWPAFEVVDARPRERQLLLLVRERGEKSKYLCGHDERDWFVAAVPEEARGVAGVAGAVRALQPEIVQEAVARIRPKHPTRRRNGAFRRQGEWFFVPEADLVVDPMLVARNEPISRGGGRPHVVECVYRRGGELVYVSRRNPRGVTQAELDAMPTWERRSESPWIPLTRDAEVFARGTVRHPDHATIVLQGWHRVLMNTEQRARAMEHVVFLD